MAMTTSERGKASVHSVPEQVAVEMIARALVANNDSISDDVRRIGAHGNNKITTAFYVLEQVAMGVPLDGELLGLAAGALSDLKELNHVFRAMQGRKR